jgi:hypothetical protein
MHWWDASYAFRHLERAFTNGHLDYLLLRYVDGKPRLKWLGVSRY